MAKTTPTPHTAAAAPAAAKRRRRKAPRIDFKRTGFVDFGPSTVNRRNRDGRTLLHRECALPSANKQPVAIYKLLQRGAVPTMKDKAGQTALHIASDMGHAGVVRNLIGHAGAHLVLATDADGQTPLHLAAKGGHTSAVRELLKALDGAAGAAAGGGGALPPFPHLLPLPLPAPTPAFLDALNTAGKTPLVLAVEGEHPLAASALIQCGADTRGVVKPYLAGPAPLLVWACLKGMGVDAVSRILAKGGLVGGVDGRDTWLNTSALHYASAQGSPPDVVRALVDAGADVDAIDNLGWTPLLYAAQYGHAGAVRALLEGGADVHACSGNGETALALASAEGHAEVVAELEAGGAGAEGMGED
jgi:ankyrin repeat protein